MCLGPHQHGAEDTFVAKATFVLHEREADESAVTAEIPVALSLEQIHSLAADFTKCVKVSSSVIF